MTNKTNIIDIINLVSIDAFVNFLDKYPLLKEVVNSSKNGVSDWDFFMTSAGAGIVLMSSETYPGEHDEVKKRGQEIYNQLPDAVDNFIDFMNKANVEDELVAPMIGRWVLWNIKQSEPTDVETMTLAPVMGRFLIGTIASERKSR